MTVRIAALARDETRVEVVLRSEETEFQSDHAGALCRFDCAADTVFPGDGTPLDAVSLDTESLEAVPLDPPTDLYDGLLFHRGRFRRLGGYRRLTATECIADLTQASRNDWFGWFVPRRLLLGDPAARDAAIHAIQACIPHARILPVGVERIVPGCLDAEGAFSIHARERYRKGDLFVYDVAVVSEDGTVRERWEGLQLRKVESLHAKTRAGGRWVRPLLAPYLERRLEELVPGARLDVALSSSRAVGSQGVLRHRPDGKPEVSGGKGISISHADGLTLAVAGKDPIGCDIELITPRQASGWRDMLGRERFRLVQLISREAGESIDTAASRVWTALECLKKAGASADMPLVLGSLAEDGWILLASGRLSTGTYITSVQGVEQSLAIAILVSGHGESV